jgi:hypothetical protein
VIGVQPLLRIGIGRGRFLDAQDTSLVNERVLVSVDLPVVGFDYFRSEVVTRVEEVRAIDRVFDEVGLLKTKGNDVG